MKRLAVISLLFLLAICCLPAFVFSQELPNAADVLSSALAALREYQITFRNLTATETRGFEIFDSAGHLKMRRQVISIFIVFPLAQNPNSAEEFRHIIAVDNKPVADAEKRAESFFEKIARSQNDAHLRQQIQKESLRFDPVEVIGYTTSPGICLFENLRNFFRYDEVGDEILDGHRTIRIYCEQNFATDAIRLSRPGARPDSNVAADIDSDGQTEHLGDLRLRASLWIDRDTFRLRREIREFSVLNYKTQKRSVIQHAEFTFRDSGFGILTPQRILIDLFRPLRKRFEMSREARIEILYSEFSKPDVEIKFKMP